MDYLHSLELQHGLLHGNWHVLSDKAVVPDVVYEFWQLSLPPDCRQKLSPSLCEIGPALNEKKTVQYLLKYFNSEPETYLPPRGAYSRVVYPSRNYVAYCTGHLTERLADEIVGGI